MGPFRDFFVAFALFSITSYIGWIIITYEEGKDVDWAELIQIILAASVFLFVAASPVFDR